MNNILTNIKETNILTKVIYYIKTNKTYEHWYPLHMNHAVYLFAS